MSKSYDTVVKDYGNMLGTEDFDKQMAYSGNDLGAVYTKEQTSFKAWAPAASEVFLNLYGQGSGDCLLETIPMAGGEKGVWRCEKQGDLNGVYYTYSVRIGNQINETVDLYARALGVNGERGMVVDLKAANPEGFENDARPAFENATDAIIYELHLRDLSADASSGIAHAGKFLGLTETGTVNRDGLATGLDHIKELGVTHIQLLPVFDYAAVDEAKPDTPQYSWGYDPKNYNAPEGSYSTDPEHGEIRIREMKQMVQTLHANGIRVNMDVVYNHTYDIARSWFQKTVPDYYYRKNGGGYSNASGCGNETASERAMMRKYIVDSVVYWAEEYHIDGFRFDLMAVHDLDTMKAVRKALDEIDPSIMVYGEGWTGGDCAIAPQQQALKGNIAQVEGVGAFNDTIRDAIKGNVFNALDKGYVNGKAGMEEGIKFGVVAAVPHPQSRLWRNGAKGKGWARQPSQSVNYISCHDNLTFWDKLAVSNADDSEETRIKMNKLGSAILLTSQGVPFFQAGEEMLRSKPSGKSESGFDENSYCSPDAVNSLKWDNKANVMEVFSYYKGLIAFRKAHSALRMATALQIQSCLTFMEGLDANVIAFTIAGKQNKETAKKITVIYNANRTPAYVRLPEGAWEICVNGTDAGTVSIGTAEGIVSVDGISAMALVQGDNTVVKAKPANGAERSEDTVSMEKTAHGKFAGIAKASLAVGTLAVAAAGVLRLIRKNNR